jgi:hypothetical protein
MAKQYKRHPESASGDFYVVNGECIACGAPHAAAPDLIGWTENSDYEHCIWKKQPGNSFELEDALQVFQVAELGCHRYGGADPYIIDRIGADYCDNAPPGAPRSVRIQRPTGDKPGFNFTLLPDGAILHLRFFCALLLFLVAVLIFAYRR